MLTPPHVDGRSRRRSGARRLGNENTTTDRPQAPFESLFNTAEVCLWDEDLSLLWEALQKLREQGVRDLVHHLRRHPAAARELLSLVRVNRANEATRRLFGATAAPAGGPAE